MKPKAKWPELPQPPPETAYLGTTWVEDAPNEIPMFDRRPNGEAPGYNSPKIPPSVCKHGEGSCEECGTTNRRDAVHTTTAGKGAVARLRSR